MEEDQLLDSVCLLEIPIALTVKGKKGEEMPPKTMKTETSHTYMSH